MKPSDFSVPASGTSKTIKLQPLIITGVGPRLNLEPLFDRIFISSPDEGNAEGKIDGIHIPATANMTMKAYAVVTVERVGHEVKYVKVGDKLLVVRAQCSLVSHDGQHYWFTSEQAIMGVVR